MPRVSSIRRNTTAFRKFDPRNRRTACREKKEDFSAFFGKELVRTRGEGQPHLCDHGGYAVRHGPDPLCREIPGPTRFFDVGIAEEHASRVWRPVWRHRDWCR